MVTSDISLATLGLLVTFSTDGRELLPAETVFPWLLGHGLLIFILLHWW